MRSNSSPKQGGSATAPDVQPIRVAVLMQSAAAPRPPMNTMQRLPPATIAKRRVSSAYYLERVTVVLVALNTRKGPSRHRLPAHPLQTASAANWSAVRGPRAALGHRTVKGRQPAALHSSNILPTLSLAASIVCCGVWSPGTGHLDPDHTPKQVRR